MIEILDKMTVQIPVHIVQWAPRDTMNRESWGKDSPNGFYYTSGGDLYRLTDNLVIFVTDEVLQ